MVFQPLTLPRGWALCLPQASQSRFGVAAIAGLVSISISGCRSVVSIADVQTRPQTYEIVRLRGTVRQQLPLFERGAYQLEDPTGTIWIVTEAPLPRLREEVLVRGRVRYEPIAAGDREMGEAYAIELKRLESKPPDLESEP